MNALTVRLKNDTAEIGRLSGLFASYATEHSIPSHVRFDLHLALEELIVNIITHGYDDEQEHEMIVELWMDQEYINARITDDARAFNPLEVTAPDVTAPLEERTGRGLGIHLVRNVMDGLEYTREEGKNVVTVRKKLEDGR